MFTNIYTQKHYIIKVDRMEVTLRYRVCVFHPHMVHWKWSSWLSRPFLFIIHCLRDTLSWSLPYCSGDFIETKTQHSTADTIHPNKHTHNGEEKFNYFKIGSASELWSIVDRVNIWNKKKIVNNFQYPVVCGYARTRTHTHTQTLIIRLELIQCNRKTLTRWRTHARLARKWSSFEFTFIITNIL